MISVRKVNLYKITDKETGATAYHTKAATNYLLKSMGKAPVGFKSKSKKPAMSAKSKMKKK